MPPGGARRFLPVAGGRAAPRLARLPTSHLPPRARVLPPAGALGLGRSIRPRARGVAAPGFDPLPGDRVRIVEGDERGFRPHAPGRLLQLVGAVRVLGVADRDVVLPDRGVGPSLLVAGQPEVAVVEDLDLPEP